MPGTLVDNGTMIHHLGTMTIIVNHNDFGDSLTFPVVPPEGQRFYISGSLMIANDLGDCLVRFCPVQSSLCDEDKDEKD